MYSYSSLARSCRGRGQLHAPSKMWHESLHHLVHLQVYVALLCKAPAGISCNMTLGQAILTLVCHETSRPGFSTASRLIPVGSVMAWMSIAAVFVSLHQHKHFNHTLLDELSKTQPLMSSKKVPDEFVCSNHRQTDDAAVSDLERHAGFRCP